MADPRDIADRGSAWIAPGSGLCFSVIVALLAPHYTQWFGATMPPFTQRFLAAYPAWIAICALALVLQAFGRTLQQAGNSRKWKLLDGALAVASVLIIAAGIIALALPVLLRPMAA